MPRDDATSPLYRAASRLDALVLRAEPWIGCFSATPKHSESIRSDSAYAEIEGLGAVLAD